MNAYRYAISLRVRHPSVDPQSLTTSLGLVAFRSWRAGEPRMTPVGTPLQGVWSDSYWCSEELVRGEWPSIPLAEALHEVAHRLEAYRPLFEKIAMEGGRSELFVGWFFEGNSGDVLTHALLRRLANLSLDLSLDYYPPDQPQNDF